MRATTPPLPRSLERVALTRVMLRLIEPRIPGPLQVVTQHARERGLIGELEQLRPGCPPGGMVREHVCKLPSHEFAGDAVVRCPARFDDDERPLAAQVQAWRSRVKQHICLLPRLGGTAASECCSDDA